MNIKKTAITAITATILGISSISNVFAERVVYRNISGDLHISDSYHYSTNPSDNNQTAVFKINSTSVKTGNSLIEIDEAPFINDNTTLLPLRAVSQTLSIFGSEFRVSWNSANKKATVIFDSNTVEFTADSKIYTINGTSYTMNGSVPIIKNGRIFIPLRVLANAMNLNIEWNAETREVTIKNI